MKHIISLGAGVQSSTMALMAAHGELLPRPDAAIFADTQDEGGFVYEWLDRLEVWIAEAPHPFPVHRVTAGSLSETALRMRKSAKGLLYSKTQIPFHTRSLKDNSFGMIPHRSCTADFKIRPISKKQREIASIGRGQKTVGVIAWIGISMDEATRMKTSRDAWCENRWPLIEQRMTRQDCLKWMESHGYPEPPRSSCVYCPFHNDSEWRRLKENEPAAFAKAVQFERDIIAAKSASDNFDSVPFLHPARIPLNEVDFSTFSERNGQLNLFENECEGHCGV